MTYRRAITAGIALAALATSADAFGPSSVPQVPGFFFVDQHGGDIQTTINAAAAAGGGEVWIGPHDYTLGSSTITCDLSTGVTIKGFGPVSRLLCGNITASTPVFSFSNGRETIVALQGVQLCANNSGKQNAPGNTGGVAQAVFVTNSQAINFIASTMTTVRDVQFWNFDRTTVWDSGGSIWGIDFENCVFGGCNKGWCIDSSPTNSFERMTVRKSSLSGCNYGIYINEPNIGASFFVDGCSLDYNVIRHVYYLGANGNTQNQALVVTNCHLETSDVCSGTTVCRVFNEGTVLFGNNVWYENGAAPVGFVECSATSFSRAKFSNNHQINGANIPFAYATTGQIFAGGYGNTWQSPNEVLLTRSAEGDVAGESDPADCYLFVSGFTPTSGALEAQRRVQYLSTGSSGAGTSGSPYVFTLASDSTFNHATGSILRLYNVAAAYWTVTPDGGGVAVTADTGSTTFNGMGVKVELIKIGGNTWRMHYV